MKCPNCTDVSLVTRRREWLAVNVCPSCHGSWVARTDLERLLSDAQLGNEHRGNERRDDWEDSPRYSRSYEERGLGRAWRDDDDYFDSHRKHYRRKSLFDQIKDFMD